MNMRFHDVFNGDADGICALHQLRLAEPAESELVTGAKRDIELLKRVRAEPGDRVTVLDVSLDRNREALDALLERGVQVRYFDHHVAGERPSHALLELVIDESPDTCTSALVDRHLGGRFRPWAVVAAFGDNLPDLARSLARTLALEEPAIEALRELGVDLNYNACGESESDLFVPPAELYRLVSRHADPFRLCHEEPWIERLGRERRSDLARAAAVGPFRQGHGACVWILPDTPWSRRVSGTFANALAIREPKCAHAVLTPRRDDGYSVSVRTPADRAPGAADFCRRFAGGGGRALAAGIDRLEPGGLEGFLAAFEGTWGTAERDREPALTR